MNGPSPARWMHLPLALLLVTAALTPQAARAAERDPTEAAVDDDSILALAGALGLGLGTASFLAGVALGGAWLVVNEGGIQTIDTRITYSLIGVGGFLTAFGAFTTLSSGALLSIDHVFFQE